MLPLFNCTSGMIITIPFEWSGSYEELVLYESLVSSSLSSTVQMKERHFYFPINIKERVNNDGSSHYTYSDYNFELWTNKH